MLQARKLQEIANEVIKYNMYITAVQEVRWKGSAIIKKENFTCYSSGSENKQGEYGTGFVVDSQTPKSIIGFEPINDRISKLRIKGKF